MDPIFEHIEANSIAYIAIGACLIPIFYLTRKYTAPLFFYILETVLYAGLFHLAFGGAVRFLAWFRDASKFRYWETSVEDLKFTTPLANFWMRDQYVPVALFYVECVALAIIVFIVVYFRPMNLGRNKYKGNEERHGRKRPQYGSRFEGSTAVAGGRAASRHR